MAIDPHQPSESLTASPAIRPDNMPSVTHTPTSPAWNGVGRLGGGVGFVLGSDIGPVLCEG
jgi:hypothetical protein